MLKKLAELYSLFKRVKQSIKLTHLDGLVLELPVGLHTIVGEQSMQLSGGREQRIGLLTPYIGIQS